MIDEAVIRKWVLNANDGIISTTGIMQGFAGAGAQENMVLFAALAVMVTGGLSLGGAAFAEAAQDRAAELEIIAEERRQLARSPQEQHDELRDHYERHGLDAELAERVATVLMRKDALAAQLETEHGILHGPPPATRPWIIAIRGVLGFISGAFPITLAVVFVPDPWRLPVTFAVVALSLTATGLVAARAGTGHPMRTVLRAITIGLFIGVLSYLAGNVFDILDQFLPQIEIDPDEAVAPADHSGRAGP